MFSLTDVIKGTHTLTLAQVDNCVEVIGGRFSTSATRTRIRTALESPTCISEYCFFDNVVWNGDHCRYIASDNTTSELSFMRHLLAK